MKNSNHFFLARTEPNIKRGRPDRVFCSVKNNRKIHQVIATSAGDLFTSNLSCFSCSACEKQTDELPACANNALLEESQSIKMQSLNSGDENVLSNDSLEIDLYDLLNADDMLAIRTAKLSVLHHEINNVCCTVEEIPCRQMWIRV